jgi:hypothetical protein
MQDEIKKASRPSKDGESDGHFDDFYKLSKASIALLHSPNVTIFSVCMCLIEEVLHNGLKHAHRETMIELTNYLSTTAKQYRPAGAKNDIEPTLSHIEACQKIWGMSRDQALAWLDDDSGVYLNMGGEHHWMSGTAIKSLLEKVSK